jgi:hypothetical protein
MKSFECNICNFLTNLKANYNRHLNTKKHCNNIREYEDTLQKKNKFLPQMTTNCGKLTTNDHNCGQKKNKKNNFDDSNYGNKLFVCDNCNKHLSTKGHLKRHQLNYCPKLKKNNENTILIDLLEEQKKLFEQERKHLYKQIESLIDKVGDTTINNTQTNNIQLNSYGNEDLSHITDSIKNKLIKMPYGMIPKLIEYVHFSENKPENKNIALTNKNDNKVKIFSNNKWIYKNKEETINDLMDGKYFILDSYYDNNNESVNNYDKFRKFYDESDKMLVDTLKKECELVLLNNR